MNGRARRREAGPTRRFLRERRVPAQAEPARAAVMGAMLGAATVGAFGMAEVRRLRSVPFLPSVAGGLDAFVASPGAADGRLHLAVLGDSVASGVGCAEVAGSFPHALAARVTQATGRGVRVRSLGVSGARISDVLRYQLPRLLADDGVVPDVAVLSVGTNDVTHLTPLRRFAADLDRAVRGCVEAGAIPVVTGLPDFRALAVLSPPLRYAGYGLGERIHRLQRQVTEAVPGAHFVDVKADVGPAFRRDPALFAEDRFHPSAAGCARLADSVAPAVVRALAGAGAVAGPP